MEQKIMEAFYRGLALLISSIFNTASKRGLAISLLVACASALVGYVFHIDSQRAQDRKEFKVELAEMRNEYRLEHNRLQTLLDTCNKERVEQAFKIARLEAVVSARRK